MPIDIVELQTLWSWCSLYKTVHGWLNVGSTHDRAKRTIASTVFACVGFRASGPTRPRPCCRVEWLSFWIDIAYHGFGAHFRALLALPWWLGIVMAHCFLSPSKFLLRSRLDFSFGWPSFLGWAPKAFSILSVADLRQWLATRMI